MTAKNLVLRPIWHDRRASGQYGRQAQRIGE